MMKIFMITYNDELTSHVEQCFRHCDCEVTTFCFPEPVYTNNFVILTEKNRIALLETLKNTTFDIIFSVEYINEVSVISNALGVIYMSWVMYLPNPDIYRTGVLNSCNCIFACDSAVVDMLKAQGAENVYYLPTGAVGIFDEKLWNLGEKNDETADRKEGCDFDNDMYTASFIGKMPKIKDDDVFGSNSKVSEECKGYMDAMAHCQRLIYRKDMIANNIPPGVIEEYFSKYTVMIPKDLYISSGMLLDETVFKPYVTMQERQVVLSRIKGVAQIYSDMEIEDNEKDLYNIHEYITDIRQSYDVYKKSKINVYVADRALTNGISHRCFDIMASGGFLLTNPQNDLMSMFDSDKEFVMFEDMADLVQKMIIYSHNDDERKEIAAAGFKKVRDKHLIIHRIKEILSVF